MPILEQSIPLDRVPIQIPVGMLYPCATSKPEETLDISSLDFIRSVDEAKAFDFTDTGDNFE